MTLGIGHDIDWLRLTWQHRKVRHVGPYRDCGETWQYQCDWAYYNFERVYLQLARGHDKTERAAWWTLIWGLTINHGQGFAAGVDRDNARLVRDAAKYIIHEHPELFSDYKVYNYEISNKRNGTVIRILASDEESNYGLQPDLLWINDFHAWRNKGFWEALWTAMGKRKGSRIWIESNALSIGTPQVQWIRPIREFARKQSLSAPIQCSGPSVTSGPKWFFYCPKGFLATWQYHQLESWKETLLPATYRRLINNEDTTDGEQFLTEEQVESAEYNRVQPMSKIRSRRKIVTVDLGYTQDASVVSAMSAVRSPKHDNKPVVTLHSQQVWTGSRDNPIRPTEVADYANFLSKQNGNCDIYTDPYEMKWIIQLNPRWKEFTFNPSNIKRITSYIFQLIVQGRLILPKDCAPTMQSKKGNRPSQWTLKRELTEAVLKEMSYGVRIDHRESGFTDRIMSLGIGIVVLMDMDPPPMPSKNKIRRLVREDTWGKFLDKLKPTKQKNLII